MIKRKKGEQKKVSGRQSERGQGIKKARKL